MATAVATAESVPVKKGPSLIIQIAALLVMTGAAVGIGWFSGGYLGGTVQPAAEGASAPAAAEHGKAGDGHGAPAADAHGEAAEGQAASGSPIVTLAPITTNLAAPSEIWVRMEVAVVFDKSPEDPTLVDTIHQDLLGFMRTVKMHQIEGASGFQHLKADLEDRASIRSEGQVKAVLIRTLLFE